MQKERSTDRFWLLLAAVSLLFYLVRSDSVRAFASEASRLAGKL